MMCRAFGAMPWLFHRIVRLIKVYLSFMPTKPLRLAVGFSVFLTAMIMAPITTTVLTVGTIPALAVTPEEILGDPKLEARARALSKQLRCLVCQTNPLTIVMLILHMTFGLRCAVRLPPDVVMKLSLTRSARNTEITCYSTHP